MQTIESAERIVALESAERIVALESAERIVALESELQGRLAPSLRSELMAEQRRLWDHEHRGRSYAEISHDVWMVRRYP